MIPIIRGRIGKIAAVPALAIAFVGVQAGEAAAARPAPKITLAAFNPVPSGATYQVSGRIMNTGARNNKTVIVQSRVGGAWRTIAVKKRQDDGRYAVRLTAGSPATMVVRTLVKKRGATLDRSPTRPLTIVAVTAPPPPSDGSMPPPPPFGDISGSGLSMTRMESTSLLTCYPGIGVVQNDPPYWVSGANGSVWWITKLWYWNGAWGHVWGNYFYAQSYGGLTYGNWVDTGGGYGNTAEFTVTPGTWVIAENWVFLNGGWQTLGYSKAAGSNAVGSYCRP